MTKPFKESVVVVQTPFVPNPELVRAAERLGQQREETVSYHGTKEELIALNLTEIIVEHKPGDVEATVDFVSPDARVITAQLDADQIEDLRDALTLVLGRIEECR